MSTGNHKGRLFLVFCRQHGNKRLKTKWHRVIMGGSTQTCNGRIGPDKLIKPFVTDTNIFNEITSIYHVIHRRLLLVILCTGNINTNSYIYEYKILLTNIPSISIPLLLLLVARQPRIEQLNPLPPARTHFQIQCPITPLQ